MLSRQEVSRLFARVAFGATAADLDTWTGQPYTALVDHLLNIPALDGRAPTVDEVERTYLESAANGQGFGIRIGSFPQYIPEATTWWIERMRTTPYPLEERMVLFWHDHFATAYLFPYPDASLLMYQNQTMRRHALGNFRALVAAMTIDPAMLYWL